MGTNSPYLLLPKATSFPLLNNVVTIGRHPENQVVLPHSSVSRFHARLIKSRGGYLIEDAGAAGGTTVNGRRVTAPTPLANGDRISLGLEDIIYYTEAPRQHVPHKQPIGRMAAQVDGARPGMRPATYAYHLRVRTGSQKGMTFPLNADRISIGRQGVNAIILQDEQVSRHHVVLARYEDGYAIEDLNSTNGTYVNGRRITNLRMLRDGDVIDMGANLTLTYERTPFPVDAPPRPVAGTWDADDRTGEIVPINESEMDWLHDDDSILPHDDIIPADYTEAVVAHDIFVSYSHIDSEIVKRIVDRLEAAGFNSWVDWQDLKPGTPEWERTIKQALGSTRAVVIFLSPEAEQSQWVARELAMAEMFSRPIYPVLIRGTERASIPLRLATHQYVDLRYDFEHNVQVLVNTLMRELRR